MRPSRTWDRVLAGAKGLRFQDVLRLAEAFGFRVVRVKGSHHILAHSAVPELLNLQEVSGEAKPYQVKQLLRLVETYHLTLGDDG